MNIFLKKLPEFLVSVCWLLAILSLLYSLVLPVSSVAEPAVEEVALKIESVDVKGNSIVMSGVGSPLADYRLSSGVRIMLLNGEPGTMSALQKGDVVQAIVAEDENLVYELYVVAKRGE